MAEELSEASKSPAIATLQQSAQLEILIVIRRISDALQALPEAPDDITLRRWNHGVARELVSELMVSKCITSTQ